MVFVDVEKDGVLGWVDWQTYDFGNDNWGYTGTTDWLPDYNGKTRIRGTALEKELTRLYYTGQFQEYARRIAEVPAN